MQQDNQRRGQRASPSPIRSSTPSPGLRLQWKDTLYNCKCPWKATEMSITTRIWAPTLPLFCVAPTFLSVWYVPENMVYNVDQLMITFNFYFRHLHPTHIPPTYTIVALQSTNCHIQQTFMVTDTVSLHTNETWSKNKFYGFNQFYDKKIIKKAHMFYFYNSITFYINPPTYNITEPPKRQTVILQFPWSVEIWAIFINFNTHRSRWKQ